MSARKLFASLIALTLIAAAPVSAFAAITSLTFGFDINSAPASPRMFEYFAGDPNDNTDDVLVAEAVPLTLTIHDQDGNPVGPGSFEVDFYFEASFTENFLTSPGIVPLLGEAHFVTTGGSPASASDRLLSLVFTDDISLALLMGFASNDTDDGTQVLLSSLSLFGPGGDNDDQPLYVLGEALPDGFNGLVIDNDGDGQEAHFTLSRFLSDFSSLSDPPFAPPGFPVIVVHADNPFQPLHDFAFSSSFSGSAPVTTTVIPEPGTISLIALGGLMMARRRRDA